MACMNEWTRWLMRCFDIGLDPRSSDEPAGTRAADVVGLF